MRPSGAQAPGGPLGLPDPASGLGLGVAMTWFSLLVLIPLAAVVVKAAGGGWETFVDTFSNPQTMAALRLTVAASLLVTALNMVMGTVIAWVLVRDRFSGKRVLDVIIDIPFALPDDRGRAGAAVPLRHGQSPSGSTSRTPVRRCSSRSRS